MRRADTSPGTLDASAEQIHARYVTPERRQNRLRSADVRIGLSISTPTAIGAAPTGAASGPGRTSLGWVPRQHGAWAMLIVPSLVGTRLAHSLGTLGWQTLALIATWLVGYFAFSAASGWLKARPARRRRWQPALLTYTAATAGLGLLTVALAGPTVLSWLAAFVPLVLVALVATARHRERSLFSGLVTVAAACLMLPVVAAPSPLALSGSALTPLVAGLTAAMFGYFGGTVLHVKSLIRGRGQRRWAIASLFWHLIAVVVAGMLAGVAGWGWPLVFSIALARTLVMIRGNQRRRLPPLTIGLVELGLSALLLALALHSAWS